MDIDANTDTWPCKVGGITMNNTWIDEVPIDWFEFKHTISAHPFCNECDLYGEKQWPLKNEYPAIMIDAPWPMFMDKPRWIWICLDCWGEEE